MLPETSSAKTIEPQAKVSIPSLASLLKAAGDPLRLEILSVLQTGAYGVLELTELFELKQSGMSHHLKVLATAGLVTTRREGNSIFYRLALSNAQDTNQTVQHALNQQLKLLKISNIRQNKIADIRERRMAISQAFFAKHTNKFREQQDLIAEYHQYADSAVDLMLNANLPSSTSALEIGPGEGEFLTELATRFKQVYALDNSSEMLACSEALIEKEQLSNVQCILGDTTTALDHNIQVDCIVCNMVLHHVPSPENIFNDVAKLLKPGGTFVITDLCHHDQSWAQDSCGDLWLGFDSSELTHWAEQAGLIARDSLYSGLRNGFHIQAHRFDLHTY